MSELDQVYNPKNYEKKWYTFWEKNGLFKAASDSKKPPYTILMPPPNVTSQLHMGHGEGYSMQDILIRWKRMCGFNALWLPGTDHAGIATQMMVEKSLEKDGITRQQLGRVEFEKKLWAWKDKYGGMITDQFRALGFSCDWDRESFTMSPHLSKAVRHVFVDLFRKGLIFRGERLVNWDCVLKTAISDDELETKEVAGFLWHFKYPVKGAAGEFLTIATTRPETMLGDTAVAVNPEDERYQHLVGKEVELPLTGRTIPIIADDYVAMDFGTGVVKITPAHDPNDFEVGKRHKLPLINIMNEDGTLNNEVPERFRGKDRFVARKEIIRALKELDLFDKEQPHKHSVPHSERSKSVIEPRLSLQWYVNMRTMAEPAVAAAKSGELKFHPDLWKKTYLHWLENIQDWCISRQLWWGHRIPIWYCGDCKGISTGIEDPTKCEACDSKNIKQDEDVLDTWFSSWLWPLSPFGWPDKTADLAKFYPSNVLVTGSEIIFLWVARMIMAGYYALPEKGLAFDNVLIVPTVCDKQGRKFSKTLGNGIDPMDMIEKYGADATRYTAVSLAPLGGRVAMSAEDFDVGGRFVNKIWNAARFVLRYVDPSRPIQPLRPERMDVASKWLVHELRATTADVQRHLETYRLNDAAERIYQFIWGSVCDWGIECNKDALAGTDLAAKDDALSLLIYVFDGAMRLASPVMPFVTEEIWQKLPHHPAWDRPMSLTIAAFPDVTKLSSFAEEATTWRGIQELVGAIRSIRSQAGVPPKTLVDIHVEANADQARSYMAVEAWIKKLAGVENFTAGVGIKAPAKSMVAIGKGFEAYMPAEAFLDIPKEKKRLSLEGERIGKIIAGIDAKLKNENFVSRAPADVLATSRAQRDNMIAQLAAVQKSLVALD